jgi:uncharacterized FlgJ-related protein
MTIATITKLVKASPAGTITLSASEWAMRSANNLFGKRNCYKALKFLIEHGRVCIRC